MSKLQRLVPVAVVLGLAVLGVAAVPGSAKAWWAGGWGCCRVGFGIVFPPVVVAPPPVYVAPPYAYYPPPPAYYPPPRGHWVPGHWRGGYWVPGHWA